MVTTIESLMLIGYKWRLVAMVVTCTIESKVTINGKFHATGPWSAGNQWRRNRVGHVGQWPTHFGHYLFFLLVTTEAGHVGGLPPTHNVNVENKILGRKLRKNVSEFPRSSTFSGLAHPLLKSFRRGCLQYVSYYLKVKPE